MWVTHRKVIMNKTRFSSFFYQVLLAKIRRCCQRHYEREAWMFKGSHLMRTLWLYLLLGRNQVELDISGGKEGEKQRCSGSMVGIKQWFGSRWLKVHIDEPNNDAEDNHHEQFNYNWWHPFLFGVRSWTSWRGLGITQTERYKKRNIKESKLVEEETERKSCLWNENLIK